MNMFIMHNCQFKFLSTILTGLLIITTQLSYAQKDTGKILKPVTVAKSSKANPYKNILPTQQISGEIIHQMNAPSAGDAAQYFSGVLIKNYGGVGGLKTISVRSLGASSTSVLYDGLPVSDVQSGQIDLSRFSSTFIQELQLFNGNPPQLPAPARAFASASVLSIQSNTFRLQSDSGSKWNAGIKMGSFGLIQPSFAGYFPSGKTSAFSIQTESLFSKGDYPFTIQNGNLSEKTKRNNSQIKSLETEINFIKKFKDSSHLQLKMRNFLSDRGLPGAVVFFNNNSAQSLYNNDLFFQSHYERNFNKKTTLLASIKYSKIFTRYKDPYFLNNSGGIDDKYDQNEIYGSIAVSHKFFEKLLVGISSDAAYTGLSSNKLHFAYPSRISTWNALSLSFGQSIYKIQGTFLHTYVNDHTRDGEAASTINKITPTLSLSIKPAAYSPIQFRIFYKEVFRMPTFNDLYYHFVGNTKLRPEYSRQLNVGISYSDFLEVDYTRLSFSLDGYVNKVSDKILAVPGQNLFRWAMMNVGKVSIYGLDFTTEASGSFSTNSQWFGRIAYTLQKAIDISDPSAQGYKDRIPYTPDHSGSAIFNYKINNWAIGYSMVFSGPRFSPGGNTDLNKLDAWSTHDVSLSKALFLKKIKTDLQLSVNNIMDTRYDVVRYFPMPGRSLTISLNIKNN